MPSDDPLNAPPLITNDLPHQKAKQPTIPRLAVLDRMPLSRAPPEVILYVPGFNASVKDEVAAL